MREVRHYLKRVLKRLDLTSRSIIALLEPGSCFAGTLAELAFAADRSAMLEGTFKGESQQPATLTLSPLNFGAFPMSNGLSRLATRFLGEPASVDRAREHACVSLHAGTALELGLVTFTYDATDWADEIRIMWMVQFSCTLQPSSSTIAPQSPRNAAPGPM